MTTRSSINEPLIDKMEDKYCEEIEALNKCYEKYRKDHDIDWYEYYNTLDLERQWKQQFIYQAFRFQQSVLLSVCLLPKSDICLSNGWTIPWENHAIHLDELVKFHSENLLTFKGCLIVEKHALKN